MMGYHFNLSAKFEPRDLWVGVYWNRDAFNVKFYVCVVPMFPIIFEVYW